jgi:amino acid adenylation domain-containing protein
VLAVMMAGGVYVPLDPRHPRERLQMVLDDAGASMLLTRGELGLKTTAKVLDVSEKFAAREDWKPIAIDAGSLAYVIYTSGSTGKPKGVAIEHGALMNLLRSMEREPGLTAKDTLVAVTTLSFDIAGLELLLPLLSGAKLVIATDDEVVDGNLLRGLLDRTRATVLQATPSAWRMLIDSGWTGALPLKALCGGEALPRELADKLLDRAAEVWNVYGPTETTIWSSATHVTRGTGALRIGPPIANTQFYVLDKRRQPVPVGVAGELYIGGDGLARGYWNRPELTAEKFVANPFGPGRTYAAGDVARWHDDGSIELLGRADFQVKIRGFRIELGEIEAALRGDQRVSDCVVVAREDEPGNPRLVAYIVASDAIDAAELRGRLKETLPEYMIPAALVMLDRLPQTPNGKVDRKALPAPASYDRPSGGGTLRTPLEEMVAAIFSDVLKIEVTAGEDNFFELGGHSLSAMQVMARVQRALGIDVPLRILFEAPTVAALAAKVEGLRNGEAVVAAPPIVAVPRDRPLALSFAQQRLWFLAQMDADNPLYNVPLALRMKGVLDVSALQQALDAVVARHEVLRTRYGVENDEPVQVIDAAGPVDLPVIDLTAMPEGERETELGRVLAREVARPFYLATDWMLRPLLVRLGAETHVLLINTHHIATDGWSNAVLLRDLAAFYGKAIGVETTELPALPIQYADYAVWQRNWLQGTVLAEQLAFWKQTLEGAPPLLQLPTDRPRPELQTHSGGVRRFDVPAELIGSLRMLGRGEGATPFMLMLAAFQVLMYYYVKQPDIVLGTDLANRTTVQTEDLVGFFVNLMVVRTNLSGDISFRELIGRVRHRTLDSYAHQDVPFDKLVEELQPERSRSHTPLVQVLFVQQNTPRSELAMEGLELSGVSLALPSKFDIAVFVRESERGLAGVWQYNADLFNAVTIERMAALYPVILKTITADADTKLKAMLEMLAEWELQHSATVLQESRELSRQKLKSVRRAVVAG